MQTADRTEGQAFEVQADDDGRRLDRVIRKLLPGASLALIYSGLRRGEVRVDGVTREPRYRLRIGERISLAGPLAAAGRVGPREKGGAPPTASAAAASGLVVYRCEHFIVFDKPRGIPVHGQHSLATMAAGLLETASRPSLSFRPGPVHRIDRDTSGLVLFAVSLTGARVLSELLRNRECEKTYLALLEGELDGTVEWRDAVVRDEAARRTVMDESGAMSVSEAEPLLSGGGLSLARVRIESGRTHQIRAQAAAHGHPLLGDGRYGGRAVPGGYVLHAARFRLPPGTPISERTAFTAPLPAASLAAIEGCFGEERTAAALERLFGEPLPRARN